jgi:hypothetical protein
MAISEAEAKAKITEAKNALNSAYEAVLDAEEGGVNISSLLTRLNLAGTLLAEAEMYNRTGDFENAYHSANNSLQEVSGTEDEAGQLKTQTINDYQIQLLWTTSASFVAIVVIALGSVKSWQFLKQHYLAKPQTESKADANEHG